MDQLYLEADVDNISLNLLINHILRRYIKWSRFENESGMIPINAPVLRELFKGLTEEQVIRVSKEIGKDAIYNIFLFMRGKLTADSFMSWYLERMKHCSDIREIKQDNGHQRLIFRHGIGENWSLYHKTIIESIFHDLLSKPIHISITSSTIIIDLEEDINIRNS